MLSVETSDVLKVLDRATIAAVIRSLWSERLVDVDQALERHAAPDILFRVMCNLPGAPGPLTYVGREATAAAVKNIDLNLEFLTFEILDMIVDGHRAALRWHAKLRNRGTGVMGDLAVFDLMTFEHGLIATYTEFLDSHGFQRLMEGDPQLDSGRRANRVRTSVVQPELRAERDPPPVDFARRSRNEQLLRAWFARRVRDGSRAVEDFWTEDGELHIVGDPAVVPFARVHAGRDEVKNLYDRADMEFAIGGLELLDVLIEGDRAAVRWTAGARHHGTGASGRIEVFSHLVLDDGRIRSNTEFFDTALTAGWIKG